MTSTLNPAARERAVNVARGALVLAIALSLPGRAAAQAETAAPAAPGASNTTTTGTVDIGGGGISSSSAKAGEYNGLQDKGFFGIANIDLRGGGAYDSDDAFRWRIRGTDLGLDTRRVAGEVGVQGRYRVNFLYDSLRRNSSDSYQTPFIGAGTDTLTLPSTWLVPVVASSTATNNHSTTTSARGLDPTIGAAPYIDTQTGSPTIGTLISPNAAQLALITAAQAADLPLFHHFDLSTKRQKYGADLSANLSPAWAVDLGVHIEHKDGTKAMGTVSRSAGGDIATIIPDLIDSDTSQVNSSVAYKRDRGSVAVGYYGSIFRNHVTSMTWQNWADSPGFPVQRMSSAPDNQFHQVNAEARYNLSAATRLVAGGSYARNTQNDPFLTDASTPVVPVTSLNGLVVSTNANATLTTRLRKATLAARYRFSDRDNRTAVHIFQFSDANEAIRASALFPAGDANPLGAVLAQNANANRPYSRKQNVANLEADYHVGAHQWVKGGYDFERFNRWCTGTWIDCADAGVTNENSLRAEWRASIGQTVNARVGYTFGARRAPDYNENAFLALVPYAGVSPSTATGGATALSFMLANGFSPWGPPLGFGVTTGNMNVFFPSNNALANAAYANNNRISEIQGFRRYYVSDRNRNRLRSAIDWQSTEKLSLEGGIDVTADDYVDARYGLQSSTGYDVNVDATYAVADGVTATAFYTFERRRALTDGNTYTANNNTASLNGFTALSGNSCDPFTTLQQRNNNNKLDPCLDWSALMRDRIHTLGFTLAKKTDKVTAGADVIYARARSTNDVSGGSWVNNPLALAGAPAGTIAAYLVPATPLPVVSTDTLDLRLNGTYAVSPRQSLRLVYDYMRMRSADWAYDGMQIGIGTPSGVLPTQETPFNYGVHVIGVSYVITF